MSILASDYYYDGLFMNRGGQSFIEETDHWIPRQEHGFSGMSVDFADFDNIGQLGIYVSNMHIPPFVQTGSLLWQRDGDHYRNIAADRGVKKCGWAWTGKFADFDNRGALDLFVINGKARGKNATSPSAAYKSFAFVRNTISTLPLQLRWDISLYPPFDDFVMSGFQPSCFFWNLTTAISTTWRNRWGSMIWGRGRRRRSSTTTTTAWSISSSPTWARSCCSITT